MVGVTLLCVWLGVVCNRANRQRQAVEAITKAGGEVLYDYQTGEDGLPANRDAPQPGPKWLRDLIGIDYFATAAGVSINVQTGASDKMFEAVEQLPHLKRIDLVGITFPGATIGCLRNATQLHGLAIYNCEMADADWKVLDACPTWNRWNWLALVLMTLPCRTSRV